MKSIVTNKKDGVCVATDNDGNSHREPSFEYSTEEAHQQACIGLCKKIGWDGQLQGGHIIRKGRSVGMVWVWIDPKNQLTIAKS
jgi:hypothetical protein